MTRQSAPVEIQAQAERWFTRMLDPDVSPMERVAFRHWKDDPRHARAFAEVEALWGRVGETRDMPQIRALMQQTLGATQAPPRRWRAPLALAASLAVAALALGTLWLWQNPPGTYRTALGEQRVLALADGSTVTLNTDTRLRVDYSEQRRTLHLLQGEALFDVAHDADRPFLVQAGSGSVTALGTRFTVRREAAEVQVTLLEGRVVVDRPEVAQQIEVAPGEQLRFTAEVPEVRRQVVDEEAVMSWTRGRLLFRATPLAEAVREVNRYAETQIRIVDPSLSALTVSGTFVTGDAENLAAALRAEMSVQVSYSPDRREIRLTRRDG
ncbi:FecR family protein [Flagellatimonas centrodinii]|uniref:FecR family protein n=1 Tax=Flagellatimonas centrodinii TaxID=2806210 RepID=UPI001FEE78C1|nr:FecR family protein [Flagellatimonas centrodinii]ULQ47269.1 FecR family protein [Flagellatimonas centrodinii]